MNETNQTGAEMGSKGFDEILVWYSGKARENAEVALLLLRASVDQGSWLKGAARKVKAALSKATVAQKFARKHEEAINCLGATPETQYRNKELHSNAFALYMNMYHGCMYVIDMDLLNRAAKTMTDQQVLSAGRDFMAVMTPIHSIIRQLDATRPIPTFTHLGVSPTLTATLETFKAAYVEICPHHWEKRGSVDPKTGKESYFYVMILDWPIGTVHGASRYKGTDNNSQCEACGHAIKNPYNWVPLLLTTQTGPKSLWVGRDCSKRLFNIEVVGEVEISKDGGRP